MKPLNLLALLLFLGGTVWTITLSPRAVRSIHKTYYTLIAPFLKSGSAAEISANSFFKEIEHSEWLQKRLESTERNYVQVQAIEGRLRELEKENAELRSALGFRKRSPFKLVPARVIRRKPSTWWDTVVIDRGEEKGVAPQLPVLSSSGLVGKTNEAASGTATVILLTDESCQVSAKVEGTPEMGILSGQRVAYGKDPVLLLRFLSRHAKLRPGMKVHTTGRGGLFPPDVLIGTILSFETGALDAQATVRPSVDFGKLGTVFILAEGKEQAGESAGNTEG